MPPVPVHPRACGEHNVTPPCVNTSRGSSPRMRGTLAIPSAIIANCRFIPAHAGNTPPALTPMPTPPVHPRACGEHPSRARVMSSPGGSSPRMRGTLRKGAEACQDRRFIPAHAGNTPPLTWLMVTISVHPRACGEHTGGNSARGAVLGSSPRMRGTLEDGVGGEVVDRFIPAHAGNTHCASSLATVLSVHPRACGEHAVFKPLIASSNGSSPRMRGTHTCQFQ